MPMRGSKGKPRHAWRTRRLAACCFILTSVFASPSLPATRGSGHETLHLEIFVNDHPSNLIAKIFRDAQGRLVATRAELKELGIAAPGRGDDTLVPIESIPGLAMRFDEPAQRLYLHLAPEAQHRRDYAADGHSPLVKRLDVTPAKEFGLVVNYNAFTTGARPISGGGKFTRTGSLSLDTRAFSPYGVLQNSAIAGTTLTKQGILRLETSFVFAHQESMTTTTLGDSISGGLNWTRPVRHGGLQISRQFGFRPDLVTAALPSVSGSAAVPSTVDVYVDNVRIATQQVGTGPFRLTNLPVSGESGMARVVVRDVTGRESVTTLPFFAGAKLLAPGLWDFSLDAGVPRYNYAVNSFDYGRRPFGMGSLRYGYSENLTLEVHAEGTRGLVNGGVGAVWSLGNFGTFNAALAGSRHANRTGVLAQLGWEKNFGFFFLGLNTQRSFGRFEDVASVTARTAPTGLSPTLIAAGFAPVARSPSVPKAMDRVSLGVPIEKLKASFSASFVNLERDGGEKSRLVALSYSQSVLEDVNAFATAFTDLKDRNQAGVFVGLSWTIGPDYQIGASYEGTRSGSSVGIEAQRMMGAKPHDYAWHAYDREGKKSERGASGAYRNPWSRIELGLRQNPNAVGGYAGVEGALIASPSGLFATNRVNDAFAIVDAGAPGVEVLRENRVVGKTDFRGKLVVPDLQSFQRTRIAINPESLSGDRFSSVNDTEVMPGFRGSAVVGAQTMTLSESARVEIRDSGGAHFPAGTRITHTESGVMLTIGYGGTTFLARAGETNTLVVRRNGGDCAVRFAKSELTRGRIGPLTCKAE